MSMWDARDFVIRRLGKLGRALLDRPTITDRDLSPVVIKDFLDRRLIAPFAGGYRWTLH